MLVWFNDKPQIGILYRDFKDTYPPIKPVEDIKIRNGALHKLIKDGYIQPLDGSVTDEETGEKDVKEEGYRISYEGMMYVSDGGYKQEFILRDTENTRLGNLENHQMRHQSYMTWLTLTLASFALVMAALEVIKMVIDRDKNYAAKGLEVFVSLTVFSFGIIAGAIIFQIIAHQSERRE